ncbi:MULTISPECIES: RNA polymerase factor sigma-54 [Cellulophaga]|uniref:RNA polymerase, sigma 54 subunit, RpoN n=1 Tax=Cellulophaga lytica (strain ATCC 23178 / DSM 7489 / JCM 8516 / NBRC 14961 / NCIMB 1423 / VKM B-1433 / Cy l20) TaxID=867900 RepID=F0RC21_CELLC|nr:MULTISPECIES: RNA polymerase factor sigma-54 [Cellulophaga]ADY29655.1 RNA polymerase, sigma 54 subunit, RpoN [Cellulophaga lytica DSM 7489]AIM60659.1 RNA polymerase sigma54 factor [Cellulophaga lytica]MDO6852456.1 RNA polymerase factor sigma-54 [Cellulophaga lytica]TVZ07796.1 RNA polymerase RpoN-/SigL-like sigma 54 subunit [Cellulophaga sp. RHA_52]WQG76173.1 RNA polymerase factor sigma-54 [Cellulophaga lytica]
MLKQHLQFKLSQKLSPQQIQLMKLIQLPTQAFEQRLKQELEENPALESGKEEAETIEDEYDDLYDNDTEKIEAEDINIDEYLSDDEIPDYRTQANNYSADDDEKSIPYAAGTSFHQHLMTQLNTVYLDDKDWAIAEFLIGSVDESGYIRRPITDIMDDLAFTQNVFAEEADIIKVLNLVQELDPPGVAARSLEECLIIQLSRKEQTPAIELAIQILEKSFDQFTKKHYKKLLQKHNITEDELKEAISEIEKLNPKPGGSYAGNTRIIEHIVPDFSIKIADGELELTLNGRNAPELHVSRQYNNMLEGYKNSKTKSKSQKDTVFFIKQKLDAAKWFIDAIKQRQQTLYVTMSAIMNYQKEYFLTGDERKLRPMILKDIADTIGMDVSTVSRVANSKYVDTPYGTKLIKEYFSESMKNEQGEDVSTKEIKKILENVISEEEKRKPLTDDKLAAILKEKGYPIARRTVAKYREQLNIPVARLRKQI